MTVETKLATIDGVLDDIKTALTTKGFSPSGDITTYAGVIDNIPAQEFGIQREVSAQGVYGKPTSNFTFSLPNNITSLGDYALKNALTGCLGITRVDLSSLTSIGNKTSMESAFAGCTNLVSVDLSNVLTITGDTPLISTFSGCSSLSSVDLSNLTTISSQMFDPLYYAFCRCTSLTSINLSRLTTLSGGALEYAFSDCTSLTNVNFSSLTTLGSGALMYAFQYCTSLTTLSFPALTSNSFGNKKSQFNEMLTGVTGCTVHFPSNLQSLMSSWTGVTNGFGGTNTTILFDLTATT